jgi:sugar/nucleoside kinase (ribokinase family)
VTPIWDLTAVGDVNADLILLHPDRAPSLGQETLATGALLTVGGSTTLTAAAAARLGLRVRLVSQVGTDALGSFLRCRLDSVGVDTDLVSNHPHRNTGITVSLSWPEDRALITFPGTVATFHWPRDLTYLVSNTRHIHVGGYFLQKAFQSQCASLFRLAKARGVTTSIDPGDDPSNEWEAACTAIIDDVDILFVNDREACRLCGCASRLEAIEKLAARVPTVVVKLGAQGAVGQELGRFCTIEAFPASVIDTTGAGDVFNAGYLSAHLRSLSLRQCIEHGAAAGALATTWVGGFADALNQVAVDDLLHGRTWRDVRHATHKA